MGQKIVVHLHDGILCSRKKEWAPILYNSLDGSGGHYIKWKKTDSERETSYISHISGTQSTRQTSKLNITRDIEIKNKLTVTRGEVEGDNGRKKGKGCHGTFIKDTWTKQRGVGLRVAGGDGWDRGSAGGKMETSILE